MVSCKDKYWFMGHWFPVNDVKEHLSKVSGISEDEWECEEDLSETIERMAKDKPSSYLQFFRSMHDLRFHGRR